MNQHTRFEQARQALDSVKYRQARTHGDKYDTSDLAAEFAPYFHGQRIQVTTTYGEGPDAETYVRTGTVSITGGWRPVFLLVRRSSDTGSSDTLSDRDHITGVQYSKGGKYYPAP